MDQFITSGFRIGIEVVKQNLSVLLEMACKMRKTLTKAEQGKIIRDNARRAKEMRGTK